MKELTEKQERTLKAIKEFISKNDYAPTVREIADAINVRSSATVLYMMKALKKKGYIDFTEGKARTIKIIK